MATTMAAAVLALSVVYRLTVNLPDLPYSLELRKPGSQEFLATSRQIARSVDELLADIPGQHNASVFQYRYHQIIGTLAYLDIYSDAERPEVRNRLLQAIDDGFIGQFPVSNEGYEFHIIREANSKCSSNEFQCADRSCIDVALRCDKKRDCKDGSDESKKHAGCAHHLPVIYQTDKVVSTPNGGIIHLSAVIDLVPNDHQVLWTREGQLVGEGTLSTSSDNRISIYRNDDTYHLRIENATTADSGTYEISINGLPVRAEFEVQITADSVPPASEGCPDGERACKSGHCLSVSQFCDRVVQCPDGDDELACSNVECTSSEIRCHTDNVCVPKHVACDGWKDCRDGSDEMDCDEAQEPTHPPHPHHHHQSHKKHSRLTVTCEDGTAPEYSLHGSSYCWSNSVCPSHTACVQGLCCAAGRNGKRSVATDCTSDEFRCNDGTCVSREKHCNREYDCRDGSDETTCEYYIAAQKHAERIQSGEHNGDHVEHGNKHPEQKEHSMEEHLVDLNGECTDQEFRCPYLLETKCFHYDKLCDGVDDCGDGSDEVNCESASREDPESEDRVTTTPEHHQLHGECNSNQFTCHDGRCIDKSLECNRKYDCDDGSDETECEYYKEAMARRKEIDAEQKRQEEQHEVAHQKDAQRDREEELKRRELELERREQEERRREEEELHREEEELRREHENLRREQQEALREQQLREQEEQRRQQSQHDPRHRAQSTNDNGDQEELRREAEERHRETEERRREQERLREQEEQRRRQHQPDPRHPAQPNHDNRQEEELRRRQHEELLRQREETRREHEERQREEERRRQHEEAQRELQSLRPPENTGYSSEVTFKEEYDDEEGCLSHEFQCQTGECIDKRRVCDTRPDCLDSSDEANCAERPGHRDVASRYPGLAQPPERPNAPELVPHHGHLAETIDTSFSSGRAHHQPGDHEARRDNDIDAEGANDVQITIYPQEVSVRDGREVTFDCRARTADNSQYPSVRWTKVGGPLPSSAHESGGRLVINPVHLHDSGRYVCVATHNGRTAEAHAMLNVQSYGPQELAGSLQPSAQCMADEKACGNNECVKADYVCDGEPDCRDRSDEANCPAKRACEPNEFKCGNSRCVQKMWLCDGDDDCGDNSDEQNCGVQEAGDLCKTTEFQCADRRQCVPSSFHCDGTNDCRDGSDEVGCQQPTVVEPPETNKQVPQGSTFSLSCRAVGVPEPYINWRLNWGPVCEPPRCLQTSEGGVGTLTVQNAQPVDQGAYTCEAINVKGRVLATPDCIVRIVEIPAPSPEPERRRDPTCDTRGAVSPYPDHYGRCECKPLVTGPNCDQCRPGSFHLSEKSPQGCLKCFCFGITDQCQSSNFQRTKERLEFAGESEGVTLSDLEERNVDRNPAFDYSKQGYLTSTSRSHGTQYWRLPQRFLGDKVTAYGGKMEFEIQYSGSGSHSREAMVVLKGNQLILVHRLRNPEQTLVSDRPSRITIETYETNYEQVNGQPATREDLMMVLADLDAFLVRATHVDNQYSTSLGDVSWEIAADRPYGDGLALEVEQCSCPPGYIGTSCEDCAPGYERSGHGPYLGTCVPIQPRAPQCTGPGVASPTANYQGRCQCKTHATGPNCDQCPANTFYMSAENPQGCIPCFCSGVTQQCQSSTYTRAKVEIDYQRGDRDQLTLSTSDARQPYSPPTPGYVSGRAIEFSSFHEANGQTLYWKLPAKFLGNKVTAYGGVLKYVFRFSGEGTNNRDPNIIIRGNDITLHYRHQDQIYPDRDNTVEVKIFEDRWQRVDGQQATREHLLMALADLDDILIKATYIDDCSQSSLSYVSLEHAEPYGRGGVTAYEVEQCHCPPGYVGTSCEDCAPGYSRTGGGLYLGLCEKCECHGHASQCDKEYGFCIDCQHNTEGDQCERCKPGFVGDPRRGTPHDCQPAATRPPCQCNNHSPRGCDSFGRCLLCEHNTEGTHCERCKKGYYGDATKGTPYDCTPCPCPGASDCYLDSQGQVACRNCPAGLSGRLCNECAPGYARSNKEAGRTCEPIGSVTNLDRTYVPPPVEVGRPPQPVIDPPHQVVTEGDAASFRCWVPGIPDCQITFHKETIGGALSHGVYQTGNALKIPRTQLRDAGNYICTAMNHYGIGTSTNATLEVVRPAPKVKVDPLIQTVGEGEPARFRCWVPGNPDVELKWYRIGKQPLPSAAREQQGILHIDSTTQNEAGQYVCEATIPGHGRPHDSTPVTLNVERPEQPSAAPMVDPLKQSVNEGDPAQFRCWVPGNPEAQLKWARADGQPLPQGTLERDGYLRLNSAKQSDAGQYICTATDRHGNPQQAPIAELEVNPQSPLNPQVDPSEQTVDEGSPAEIRCWVEGNPNVQLRWSKKGRRPLPQGAHERDGRLTIPRTTKADEDEYICMAFDPNTRQQAEAPPARVNVRSASIRPEVDPKEQTVPEGSPFRIRCFVRGHPHIALSWRKKEGALPDEAEQRGGFLSANRAKSSDAGEYICSATDPSTDKPVDSEPATVHVTGSAPRIRPEVDPSEQTVPENSPFRIRCFVRGHPGIALTWRKKDGSLPEGAEQRGGFITVNRAHQRDAGDYICSAVDPSTNEPVDSEPATVHINPEPAQPLSRNDAGPEVSPPEQRVPEGDPAVIRCWVQGVENAQLSWKRKNALAMPFGASEDGGSLSIPSTQLSDAGDYVCIYHPENGGTPKESTPSRLIVERPGEPPHPVATPPVLIVKRGGPARFHCDAHSTAPATIEWGFGDSDTLLPEGAVHEGHDVVIESADYHHVGQYICTATNPFGTGEAEPVRLEVTEDEEEPPTARVEPRVWNGQPGSRHQFTCHVTGVPTPTVEWSGPGGTPLPHDVTPLEGNILDFANGRSELNGDYTCTATNVVGTASDYGAVNIGPSLIVKTTPAGPRLVLTVGEPLHVKCEAFGDPDPDVEWLHDPGPERGDLPDDYKPVTISEQFIHHPSIGLGNAGIYTCKGSNSFATATKDIYIEVVEPSKIATVSILGGSAQTFEEGSASELICTATGSSLVDRLEWVKVDDQLPTDVEEHNEPGLLHFPNFKNSYAGEYECRGYRNDELIASSTVTVHSAAEDHDEPMVEIEPPRVRIVAQGDSIVLKCSVEGAKNGENFEWALLRGGSVVRKLGSSAELTIKKADPTNDFGVYRCNVADDNGLVIGSAFTAVTVGFEGQSNAQVMKFEEKSDASFVCPVYSVPGSKVQWSRSDGEIPASAVPNGNRIEIKDFDESSAGLYTCKVTFEGQEVEGYVHAQIYVPDTIIQVHLDYSSENINAGDRAYFDCKVTGDPSAEITWIRDGYDSLPENAQVTGSRLYFNEVTEDNAGVYRCQANTKAGPLETRAVMNIGSGKRKRKHTRRGRRAQHLRRHHRRHAQHAPRGSLFGNWFSTTNN